MYEILMSHGAYSYIQDAETRATELIRRIIFRSAVLRT